MTIGLIIYFAVVAIIMAFVFAPIWVGDILDRRKDRRKEYVEYATAELLANIWHDPEAVGECMTCGMDDLPVICSDWVHGENECKWCRELSNLNHHLKYNGVRRFRKAK